MRAVIQRVNRASVTINENIHAETGPGLLVFLGIETDDQLEDIDWLCHKIIQLRVFNDARGVMNLSVQDIKGDVLVISQFTLHAKIKKGNRPSYIKSARPEIAIPIYETFINSLQELLGRKVYSGQFGAYMKISLENDGPVTIWIDTKNKE